MPRATLLAGCLLLGLTACKHGGEDSVSENLYGTDDPTFLRNNEPNLEVNLDMPGLSASEVWSRGGKALEVRRSSTCASDSEGERGCNETSYRFLRESRELALEACHCAAGKTTKKLTLTAAQTQELDKYMASLAQASGPQVSCPPDSDSTDWELIVEGSDAVPQSFPVALCGGSVRQATKINDSSFQGLYEYLKKSLPE